MKKLHPMGIGPIIGGVVLPWMAITLLLSIKYGQTFHYANTGTGALSISGWVLIFIGLLMYFLTVPALMNGIRKTKLMTRGTFYLCCNPLYTSIILFVIPGISLLMNSWIILSASLLGYLFFKFYIRKEYKELEEVFGTAFHHYRERTPEFFPFPLKKWIRQK